MRPLALGTAVRWASLLPDGYCPPCTAEMHRFLGYGSTEIIFDRGEQVGLHHTDGMRKAIEMAGITPRTEPWQRFQGDYDPSGPIVIVPTSSLSIKDFPMNRWHELAVYWDALGIDVEWQHQDSDLWELEAQLRRASVVVGVDTGPLHLADYMGIPVVGLYGLTTPARHGPLGVNSQAIHHPYGVDRIDTSDIAVAVKKHRWVQ